MKILSMSFSPLKIGSMVVTVAQSPGGRRYLGRFQSPKDRVNGCNFRANILPVALIFPFSPLKIGSMVVTGLPLDGSGRVIIDFQSPKDRVNGCNVSRFAGWDGGNTLSVP